jgi:hypothetical protein
MRYMFLIYSQERAQPLAPEEAQTLMDNHWAVMQDTRQKGVLLGVDALKPTSTATTVRVSGGSALTTDGPFAETKEQLAGYYLLECKDLDEAIEWAKRIPTGCKGAEGCIEIRPVHELSRRL